jgi:hypothetical protein
MLLTMHPVRGASLGRKRSPQKNYLLLTLILTLTLLLTEVRGFSPRTIYERARLRALSSKYEFDFKDFDLNCVQNHRNLWDANEKI